MQYFDSHAHLSDPQILPQIEGVLQRSFAAGVSRILNICTDQDTFQAGQVLQERFQEVRLAAATTPHDVAREGKELFPLFAKAAHGKQLVAIGETGLDYYYKELDRNIQKEFLKRYLHLALETTLPVIFHCREAFDDLFRIADAEYAKRSPAVVHCFTGGESEAREVLSRGWHISFSGIVTFKKSEALRAVAALVPLDHLLIETDTPYLAPQSHRGQPNEPSYLPEIAQCIAAAKQLPMEEVATATYNNALRLFFPDSV